MKKLLRLLPLVLLLAACAKQQPSATPSPAVSPTPSAAPTLAAGEIPPAAEAARTALAARLGIDPASIRIVTVEAVDWSTPCLGLPQPGEACAAVITPGYFGILATPDGQQVEFHSDLSGAALRFLPAAALAARQVLAQQLGLEPLQVRVLLAEAVDWSDACLGISVEGQVCVQVVTPGYRILLEVDGRQYEYHTDADGRVVLLASAPPAGVGTPILAWTGSGAACQAASLGSDQVAFGNCGGALVQSAYVNPLRPLELGEFAARYAPFEADTPAGHVIFNGQGGVITTPPEQRMLAEFARLVALESTAGRSGSSWGLAFAWHRQGGIAGFCDDVSIYVSGEAFISSCRADASGSPTRVMLNSGQLEQVYAWVDGLRAFDFEVAASPDIPDSMGITLHFFGTGANPASDADVQNMQNLAAQVAQ